MYIRPDIAACKVAIPLLQGWPPPYRRPRKSPGVISDPSPDGGRGGDEGFITLAGHGARGLRRRLGKRRRGGEPEADEYRQAFHGDADIPFHAGHAAIELIEAFGDDRLAALRIVRREERCDGRFRDHGLRLVAARGGQGEQSGDVLIEIGREFRLLPGPGHGIYNSMLSPGSSEICRATSCMWWIIRRLRTASSSSVSSGGSNSFSIGFFFIHGFHAMEFVLQPAFGLRRVLVARLLCRLPVICLWSRRDRQAAPGVRM